MRWLRKHSSLSLLQRKYSNRKTEVLTPASDSYKRNPSRKVSSFSLSTRTSFWERSCLSWVKCWQIKCGRSLHLWKKNTSASWKMSSLNGSVLCSAVGPFKATQASWHHMRPKNSREGQMGAVSLAKSMRALTISTCREGTWRSSCVCTTRWATLTLDPSRWSMWLTATMMRMMNTISMRSTRSSPFHLLAKNATILIQTRTSMGIASLTRTRS